MPSMAHAAADPRSASVGADESGLRAWGRLSRACTAAAMLALGFAALTDIAGDPAVRAAILARL